MRTRLSLYNTIAAALLQLVNMVVNFILPRILISQYGSAMNGLVSSTRQMISYFTIVEAGLMGAAVFALYKPLAAGDRDTTSGIASAANRYYNISGLAFAGMVLGATFLYPLFVANQGIGTFTVGALVAIIGASGAMEFFLVGKYKVLFTADQKSYLISAINAIGVVANAVILIVMAGMRVNMVYVQLAALLGFLLRSGLYVFFGRRAYRHLNFHAKPDNRALDKRWDSLFLQILGLVSSATPVTVTTLMCGLEEVSIYVVYNMVFLSVSAILSTFNNGLSAMFGDILARGEVGVLQRAYRQYEMLYYALLGWGYACAAILIMPFIGIYTDGFIDADYLRPEIAWLFVIAGLANNIKTPQGMLLNSAGLFRETRIQSLIQASLNLGFSIALAPRFGMAGVLVGTIVANVYRCVDLIHFIPKQVTHLPSMDTVRRVVRMGVLFCLSVFPVVRFVRIAPAGWLGWLAAAALSAIWVLIIFVAGNLLMERQNAKETIARFAGVFQHTGRNRKHGGES